MRPSFRRMDNPEAKTPFRSNSAGAALGKQFITGAAKQKTPAAKPGFAEIDLSLRAA
jgi:hypothetical protein